MKNILYLIIGIVFGIVMFKSEAASWFRIYEMFKFKSFHMYGIIGSAIFCGIIFIQLIKRLKMKSFFGNEITITPKPNQLKRTLIGGIIFGLGWAITGACPGPLYVLVGAGYLPILIVIFGAMIGTLLYGILKNKIPH